ncbi:MAG: sensor histidine kinase [Bacteroidales bacterium]
MPNTDQQVVVSRPAATQSSGETGAPTLPGALSVQTELMERLSSHRTLGGAPREELAWVAAHGQMQHYEAGEVVSTPSRPVAGMFVVLSGRVSIHIIRGDTRHKIAEWHAGEVTGLLPYSRMVAPPGETIVDEAADTLLVPRERLPEMTRECHELTGILVHVMLDRARLFNSTMLHDEKLKSVGKLAAGLAHELNNPAAAITRFAKTLPQHLESVETASRALGAAALTPDESAVLDAMRAECLATPVRAVRSPLEDAEREAAIADWLEAHGVHPAAAEVVAQSRMTLQALERFAASVRPDVLGAVVSWVAADCAVRGLATEIEQAGTRISGLVKAVRGFTQVDATAVPEAVDIADGLGQTLTVLGAKARSKSIRVSLTVVDGLPPVRGVAAELNQIWVNLIDNALDAAPAGGSVEVTAAREREGVVVRVIDNGAGIPAEIRQQIFDPFFTTKDVGQGTGLGLDIVRRLVDRHNGDIEVQSRPGRTEFIVSLPLAEHRAHGGGA